MSNESFSEFLVKKKNEMQFSNSKLAKLANMSAVYLGEIIKNRKKPPDKEIQYALADALQLTGMERINLFNLAAKERREIPIDVYDYLLESEELIDIIRAKKYGTSV